MKFGLRWYNPTTGAWTQQDTLDAPLDPANANRCAFAGGDPINSNDASGRSLDEFSWSQVSDAFFIGGAAGAAGGCAVGAIAGSIAGPEGAFAGCAGAWWEPAVEGAIGAAVGNALTQMLLS